MTATTGLTSLPNTQPLTIRFASWERVSTEDRQDPQSSRAWQYARGKTLIAPHGGQIVAEFFDIDKSRSIPPQRRPEASRLLAAPADPGRGFDAVVVGEPQRAFYGNQFGNTFPVFAHYGVPLWVPEIGGPIDPDNDRTSRSATWPRCAGTMRPNGSGQTSQSMKP
ncbi:MAG TPA: hypothetical protein VMV92_20610 [Streptosporangiaceae bacterium]|nr:hypothetical protein [Streptosporangiaceae bacterium]